MKNPPKKIEFSILFYLNFKVAMRVVEGVVNLISRPTPFLFIWLPRGTCPCKPPLRVLISFFVVTGCSDVRGLEFVDDNVNHMKKLPNSNFNS